MTTMLSEEVELSAAVLRRGLVSQATHLVGGDEARRCADNVVTGAQHTFYRSRNFEQ